jgi:hypothetical protein
MEMVIYLYGSKIERTSIGDGGDDGHTFDRSLSDAVIWINAIDEAEKSISIYSHDLD